MSNNSDRMTIAEIRATGHCVTGIKRWFESQGFDFRDVLKDGVSIEEVEARNDPYGNAVVAKVKAARHG